MVDPQPDYYSRLFSNNAIADFAASKQLIESQYAPAGDELHPEPQQTIQSVFHVIEQHELRSSYGGTDATDELDQFLLADEEQSKKLDTDSVKEEQPPQLNW